MAQANHSYLEIGADPEHSFPQSEQVSYEQELYTFKGQASSNMALEDGARMISKPTHHGPSQQVKSKSKSGGNPASATRRKSSISNSRKPIAITEPSHLKQNYNKEIPDFVGLGPQSNYTTTNAKNQRIGSISGDPNSMNFGPNLPIGVGTTINSNGQGVKGVIKLQGTQK